jgi:threonine/homoserine/homoserine lactone efflux protein
MPHISLATLGAFVLTSLVIELTPRPNIAYLAVTSLGHGRRAGFAVTLGIALGLLVVGIGAALGLATIISSSHLLYDVLRWAGFVYLLWLAWEGWQDATETSPTRAYREGADSAFFERGFITNLLNPKAAIFYIAVLPEFIESENSVLWQTITLSVVYVFIATAIHVTIVLLAGSARPFLEDQDRNRSVRRALSVGLAFIAVWFAFATARGTPT